MNEEALKISKFAITSMIENKLSAPRIIENALKNSLHPVVAFAVLDDDGEYLPGVDLENEFDNEVLSFSFSDIHHYEFQEGEDFLGFALTHADGSKDYLPLSLLMSLTVLSEEEMVEVYLRSSCKCCREELGEELIKKSMESVAFFTDYEDLWVPQQNFTVMEMKDYEEASKAFQIVDIKGMSEGEEEVTIDFKTRPAEVSHVVYQDPDLEKILSENLMMHSADEVLN